MDKTNLKAHTTFALQCEVDTFVTIKHESEIEEVLKDYKGRVFVLGGGSNIILPSHLDALVLKIENKGIEKVNEDENSVIVKVASGEVWDDVVAYTVDHNYAGIEALSAIPGTCGATPVQNVGAYGSEIKDVLLYIDAYDLNENKFVKIENKDCNFAYRTSRFKKEDKGRFIITNIYLKLSKNPPKMPEYKGVKDYFKSSHKSDLWPGPSLQEIRDAIIEIRWSKLPKPHEVPNCGSFFENPIVSKNKLTEVPDAPFFEVDSEHVKIPAGWLIEHAGLKGVSFGSVGVYDKNALVLINNGSATQDDVIKARDQIIEKVKQKFGIVLSSEPEIIK